MDDIGFGVKDDNYFDEDKVSYNYYKCSSCECVFFSSNVYDKCPICSSSINSISSINYKVDGYIPFNIDMNTVKNKYSKLIHNPIIPSVYKKSINNISKVYIPCSVMSGQVSGECSFKCSDKDNSIIERYNSNFNYNNVLLGNYSKIDDGVLNSIGDYDYSLINHDIDYSLPIVISNVDDDTINNRFKKRVLNNSISMIRDNINSKYKKLDGSNMNIINSSRVIINVPVYLLNINYKGKSYLFIMNGSTGKSYIELCTDRVRSIIFSIVIFVIVFIILYLIMYFI